MSDPVTLRENLEHALVDLKFGYVAEARGRIRAALYLLDNAEVEEYGLSPRYLLILDPEGAS